MGASVFTLDPTIAAVTTAVVATAAAIVVVAVVDVHIDVAIDVDVRIAIDVAVLVYIRALVDVGVAIDVAVVVRVGVAIGRSVFRRTRLVDIAARSRTHSAVILVATTTTRFWCGNGWNGQEQREREGKNGSDIEFHV